MKRDIFVLNWKELEEELKREEQNERDCKIFETVGENIFSPQTNMSSIFTNMYKYTTNMWYRYKIPMQQLSVQLLLNQVML